MSVARMGVMAAVVLCCAAAAAAQGQEAKAALDTIVVQAEGTFEADPDVALLTFEVRTGDKHLEKAYGRATESMNGIVELAQKNGVGKDDLTLGALRVTPRYDWNDKKQRARSYVVTGTIVMRLRDFAKVGPLMDQAIQEGVVELRSLEYELSDEEGAKQKAVAEAMRRAEGRARAALGSGRKLGAVRSVNVDVKPAARPAELRPGITSSYVVSELNRARELAIPVPETSAEKIRVSAAVWCVFEIGG